MPTPEAERLLVIAEDETRAYGERVAALRDLGRLGDRGSVARLLRLITPASDVVTLNAIYAVGEVGDARALPKLRELRDQPVDRVGKINVAFDSAIGKLQRQAEPGAAPNPAR